MKKSKLLIPAVAFLVVSIAAAGTSTVAWFTANTRSTATISNLNAVARGSLEMKYKYAADNGFGSTAVAEWTSLDNQNLTMTSLRDASLDLVTASGPHYAYHNVDTKNQVTTTEKDFTYATLPASSIDTKQNLAYYAKISLQMKLSSITGDLKYGVFFNATDSHITTTGATKTTGASSYRFGFVTGTDTSTATAKSLPSVWAPKYNTTADAVSTDTIDNSASAINYVSSATATGTYPFTSAAPATYVANNAFSTGTVTEGTSLSTNGNCLGLFANTTDTLYVDMYIWYEGLDDYCTNDLVQDKSFTGTLVFDTVVVAS